VKNQWLIALNIIAVILFTDLACAFQTSLWMQVLGNLPPPMIWLPVLTYVILHRHIGEGVFTVYLITFVLCAYTVEPFEHLLLNSMVCLVFILVIKHRIYWASPNYFMLMTAAATGLHFVLFAFLSQFLDRNPLRSPEFFHWVISFLLTLLASLPIYRFLRWLDRLSGRDDVMESIGGLV
jgi:hypothetical protein